MATHCTCASNNNSPFHTTPLHTRTQGRRRSTQVRPRSTGRQPQCGHRLPPAVRVNATSTRADGPRGFRGGQEAAGHTLCAPTITPLRIFLSHLRRPIAGTHHHQHVPSSPTLTPTRSLTSYPRLFVHGPRPPEMCACLPHACQLTIQLSLHNADTNTSRSQRLHHDRRLYPFLFTLQQAVHHAFINTSSNQRLLHNRRVAQHENLPPRTTRVQATRCRRPACRRLIVSRIPVTSRFSFPRTSTPQHRNRVAHEYRVTSAAPYDADTL